MQTSTMVSAAVQTDLSELMANTSIKPTGKTTSGITNGNSSNGTTNSKKSSASKESSSKSKKDQRSTTMPPVESVTSSGEFQAPKGRKKLTRKTGERMPNQYKPTYEEDDGQDSGELNGHIQEKFGRHGTGGVRATIDDGMPAMLPRNLLVSKYELEKTDHLPEEWRKKPEIPTVEELSAGAVELSTNLIDGAYESVEEYLETHYELLREDAIAGLREAIAYIRKYPHSNDTHEVAIYENVSVHGCRVLLLRANGG